MRLGFRFGFDGGEELRRHHLNRALEHALSNTGYCTANLHVALVADYGHAVSLFEIEITSAFKKARLTFAFHHHPKMMWRLQVFEANVAGEDALDGAHSRSQSRRISILSGLLETLASGYAPLQNSGVNQSLVDALGAGVEFVGAFDFHKNSFGFRVQGQKCMEFRLTVELVEFLQAEA